jgi:hypothetical protein
MKERINKPRAFLSYANQDAAFVETIQTDLRKCQIETWRDKTDIRDGQPWLESIFEDGLPTCDVIITYFSESALKSGMVTREVDAAQIRQLKESGVSFLPYVNRSETRKKLRLDIQRLQCPVWNEGNYYERLPIIVGEIWRSYIERIVGTAVLQEKNKRLEMEIELQELKATSNSSAFSPQEEKEFEYIYRKLDAAKEILIRFYVEATNGTVTGKFSFLKFLMSFVGSGWTIFETSSFRDHILSEFKNAYPSNGFLSGEIGGTLLVELRTYGFVETRDVNDQFQPTVDEFTSRMYRFRFWLEVNSLDGKTRLLDLPKKGRTK